MPIFSSLLAWLLAMAGTTLAEPSAEERAAYDAACVSKMGAGYIANYDANGDPVECIMGPTNPCFFGQYTDAKTGQPGCCGAPGLEYMFDKATKNGACCTAGESYVWTAAKRSGGCVKPQPPAPKVDPPLACPGSNGVSKTINGITFKVYCNKAVWRWIPAIALPWYRREVAKMPQIAGVTTAEACLRNCAYDPKCQGANWMENKSCGKNVHGSGLYGNMYQNPPSGDTWGYQCMAFVSVPKRPGT